MAVELELGVAHKKESMDLCFIPDGDTAGFLSQRLDSQRPGQIVDSSGEVLGEHPGLGLYTIGQRKGLGIATGKPRYVLELNVVQNTLVVGDSEELERAGLKVDELNWIASEFPERAEVQYRSSHRVCQARLEGSLEATEISVHFEEPQRALSPGQAAVFYHGDEVLGGGTIASAF